MPEENKAPTMGGLNLNQTPPPATAPAPAPVPDADSQPKADNADQTVAGASALPRGDTGLTQTQRGDFGEALAGIDDASAIRAADSGVTGAAEGEVIYTSHPIQRFKLGRFVFENSVLRLNEQKDKDDFTKILNALSPRDRLNIRKLSLDKVDEIVQQRAAATRQFDSSVGREALEALRGTSPTIGREDIAHAAVPQGDHNVPQVPTEPVDPEGKTGLDQGSHLPPQT